MRRRSASGMDQLLAQAAARHAQGAERWARRHKRRRSDELAVDTRCCSASNRAYGQARPRTRAAGRGVSSSRASHGRRTAPRGARGEGRQPGGCRRADPDSAASPREHRDGRLGHAARADLHRSVSPRATLRPSVSTGPKSAISCARRWAASASPPARADVFEPADPRRTMPKGLVIGAIAGCCRADRAV